MDSATGTRITRASSAAPAHLRPLEPFKDDILLTGNLTHGTGARCWMARATWPGAAEAISRAFRLRRHGRYQIDVSLDQIV
jgi:hypothetical protein